MLLILELPLALFKSECPVILVALLLVFAAAAATAAVTAAAFAELEEFANEELAVTLEVVLLLTFFLLALEL